MRRHVTGRHAGTLLAALLVTAGACGGERGAGSPGAGVTVRVEDGVTVVENGGLHLADTLAWRIDTTAVVRIGVLEGPEEYVFGRIRGIAQRSDGTVVVADALARELRLYDLEGRFVRRVGRAGEGPGEFGTITGLALLAGDSLAVISGQRVDLLGPDLQFARRFNARLPREEMSVEPPLSSDRLEGLFEDGRALMGDYIGVCGRDTEGVCVDSIAFKRIGRAGGVDARFGRFVYGRQERRQLAADLPVIATREPYPQAFWTVGGDRFYYGDARRFEVFAFTSGGSLERRIRLDYTSPEYTRDDVWPPLEEPPAPSSDPRLARLNEAVREIRASAEVPDTFPAFSDLLVDATGHVWVREYLPSAPSDERPPRWFVFDPEGRLGYAVRSVPGMDRRGGPLGGVAPFIGERHVIGRVEDELGVESVVVYDLVKGS